MKRFVLVGIVAGVTSLGVSKASAALDLLLDINGPDIKGDSQIKGYEDWIVVDSFGISVTSSASVGSSGSAQPILNFSDLLLAGSVSKASPLIWGAVLSGTRFDQVRLDILQPGIDKDRRKATWMLEGAFATSYSTQGSSGSTTPFDQFSFTYEEITYTYFEYDSSDNPIGTISVHWNRSANTSSMTTEGTVSSFEFLGGTLVPEPGAAVLLALPVMGGLLRRRRAA